MPTYVTLAKWTDQGIRHVKEAPKRIEAFESAVKAAGGKQKDMYMLMGEYDLVVVTEAPNDEAVARLALVTGGSATCARRRCGPLAAMRL